MQHPTEQRRILVVDDEVGMCNILEKILTKEGYAVLKATSGQQALGLLKQHSINLIILDIKMPEMDGIATLQRIREIDSRVVVVMLTAYGTLNTARRAMELGAFDYITKPFDNEFVKSVVREGLAGRERPGSAQTKCNGT